MTPFLQEALEDAETELREVTSDASVASALLELAEAQKFVQVVTDFTEKDSLTTINALMNTIHVDLRRV